MMRILFTLILGIAGLGILQAQSFGFFPPENYTRIWEKKEYDDPDSYKYGFFLKTPWGFYSYYSDTTSYDSTGIFSMMYFAEHTPVESQAQMAWAEFQKLPADSTYLTPLLEHPPHMWVDLLNDFGDNLWFAEKYLGDRRARIGYDDSFQSFHIEVEPLNYSEPSVYPDADSNILRLFSDIGIQTKSDVPGLYTYICQTEEESKRLLEAFNSQNWELYEMPAEALDKAVVGKVYTVSDEWEMYYFVFKNEEGELLAEGGLLYLEENER